MIHNALTNGNELNHIVLPINNKQMVELIKLKMTKIKNQDMLTQEDLHVIKIDMYFVCGFIVHNSSVNVFPKKVFIILIKNVIIPSSFETPPPFLTIPDG